MRLYRLEQGLDYLHSLGIMHRDIKSLNVLVDENYEVAKLSDFGLAKVTTSVKTATGGRSGKVRQEFRRDGYEHA